MPYFLKCYFFFFFDSFLIAIRELKQCLKILYLRKRLETEYIGTSPFDICVSKMFLNIINFRFFDETVYIWKLT